MSTASKVALTLGLLTVVLLTVPSAVAGFDVPDNGNWEYSDDVSSSADKVEDVYIEDREDSVLFGADIDGASQTGLDGDTLQVYIDTDEGETGKQSESGFYDDLDPINADYRISKTDGGLPILQEYNGQEERYEFVEGVEYKEKNKIAVVKVDKELLDNPELFDVKFAHIYDDISDSDYDWLPASSTESYRIDSNGIGANTRKSATINVQPSFSEPLNDATVTVELEDDNGDVVGEKPKEVNSDTTTVTFEVDPDNFNGGEASAEVVVEEDERFAVDEGIDNTAGVPSLSDGDTEAIDSIDGLEFSYIESVVRVRDDDELDSVAFTLSDDDTSNEDRSRDASTDATNRNGDSDTKSIEEIFTVNSKNFDSNDGTLSVAIEGSEENRPLPDRDKDVTNIDSAPDIDFDLSNVPHEFIVEKANPGDHPLDIGDPSPDDGFAIDVSLKSDSGGADINTVTQVIEFDDRLDGEQVIEIKSVDFYDAFDDGPGIISEHTVEDGEVKIKVQSIDKSDEIVASGNEEKLANINFKFKSISNLQEDIDYGSENSESLTLNTVSEDSELIDTSKNQVSYSATDANVEVENLETRLTEAEVTHRTDGGDMVHAPLKIDVEVDTNDGKLDKIELLDSNGNTIEASDSDVDSADTDKNCEDKSTCDKTLEYVPDKPSEGTPSGYGAIGHEIKVTTASSGPVTLSEEFETISDSDLETVVYAEGDVNKDGPSKSKTVRRSDVNTVFENRGEEAGGLPWDNPELARSDLNNDGQIDINDVTSVIEDYNPAEGSVDFSNDPLDVSGDTVDIDIGQDTPLNNVIDEDVDAVIVNNDGDETKDITTAGNTDLTDGAGQSVNIDTNNVNPGDELEVQIHEVGDPKPDDAGGNPIATATENVKISPAFDSAEVTDSNAGQLRVTFDADVSASTATGFSVTSDGTAINVDSFDTVENGNTVVLNLDRDVSNSESLTAGYDGSGDVTSSVDNSAAETFSGETVNNKVS